MEANQEEYQNDQDRKIITEGWPHDTMNSDSNGETNKAGTPYPMSRSLSLVGKQAACLPLTTILPRPSVAGSQMSGTSQTISCVPVLNKTAFPIPTAQPTIPVGKANPSKLGRYKYHAFQKQASQSSVILLPRPPGIPPAGTQDTFCVNNNSKTRNKSSMSGLETAFRSPNGAAFELKGDALQKTSAGSVGPKITVNEKTPFTNKQSVLTSLLKSPVRTALLQKQTITSEHDDSNSKVDNLTESINRVATGGGEIESPDTLVERRKMTFNDSLNSAKESVKRQEAMIRSVKRRSMNEIDLQMKKMCPPKVSAINSRVGIGDRYGVLPTLDVTVDPVSIHTQCSLITAVEASKLSQVKGHHLLSLTDEERNFLKSKNYFANSVSDPKTYTVVSIAPTVSNATTSSMIEGHFTSIKSQSKTVTTPVKSEHTSPMMSLVKDPILKEEKSNEAAIDQDRSSKSPKLPSKFGPIPPKKVYYVLSSKDIETIKSRTTRNISKDVGTKAEHPGGADSKSVNLHDIKSYASEEVRSVPELERMEDTNGNAGGVKETKADKMSVLSPQYCSKYTVAELLEMKRKNNVFVKPSTFPIKLNGHALSAFHNKGLIIKLKDCRQDAYLNSKQVGKVNASRRSSEIQNDKQTEKQGGKRKAENQSAMPHVPIENCIKIINPKDVVIKKGNTSTTMFDQLKSPEIKQATIEAISKMKFKTSQATSSDVIEQNNKSHLTVKIQQHANMSMSPNADEPKAKKRKTLPAPKPKDRVCEKDQKNKRQGNTSVDKQLHRKDLHTVIKRLMSKTKHPCLKLLTSLDLIPKNPAESEKRPSWQEELMSASKDLSDNRKDTKIPNTKRLANIMQIYKHENDICVYSGQRVKLTLGSGSNGGLNRWFEYMDYPCVLHMSNAGLVEHIEVESIKQGLYVAMDCKELTLRNQDGSLRTVLSAYPPHFSLIPVNTLAIVIGDIYDDETSKDFQLEPFQAVAENDCDKLERYLWSFHGMGKCDVLNQKYCSVTEKNQSPRCHSPIFYSRGMQMYFDKMYVSSDIELNNTMNQSNNCLKRRSCTESIGAVGKFSKFSERAMALKMKQNELMETCRKFKVTALQKSLETKQNKQPVGLKVVDEMFSDSFEDIVVD